ncbi:hypothetical protein AVEN_4241-1 [Araneus ventricosus]|uniref:Uncharacterized protein n=1 Tax=Araneus ventricosus TaxID=182803 RepID=A0A4Y2JMN1_ARAVE|nr:hypothetical protein AVEN_4241-1 [Araneus ventricosus]
MNVTYGHWFIEESSLVVFPFPSLYPPVYPGHNIQPDHLEKSLPEFGFTRRYTWENRPTFRSNGSFPVVPKSFKTKSNLKKQIYSCQKSDYGRSFVTLRPSQEKIRFD